MANLYRDEFLFEGVVFDYRFSPAMMNYFRDELTLQENDVFVATFGKSGKPLQWSYMSILLS